MSNMRLCVSAAILACGCLGGADAFAVAPAVAPALALAGRSGQGICVLTGATPACRYRRSTTMQMQPGSGSGLQKFAKPVVWGAWLLYLQHVFLRFLLVLSPFLRFLLL